VQEDNRRNAGIHCYSDVYSCSNDYKADAVEKIRKENPEVGEKIQKILTLAGIQNSLTICKLKIDMRGFIFSRSLVMKSNAICIDF
jgi:hypothetical protein